jgi:hypothetical protein
VDLMDMEVRGDTTSVPPRGTLCAADFVFHVLPDSVNDCFSVFGDLREELSHEPCTWSSNVISHNQALLAVVPRWHAASSNWHLRAALYELFAR